MAATVTSDQDFDVQILEETVQGEFQKKNALMGSRIASAGGVVVNGQMMAGDPSFIGNDITVPYFGTLGEFSDNPENTAVVPKVLKTTNETATITRDSLAFEITTWARNSGSPEGNDPYQEATRQMVIAAERRMDDALITAARTTPLVSDVYNAGTPVFLTYDRMVDAQTLWGDESEDIIAAVVHSQAMADLRKLADSQNRPLMVDSQRDGAPATFAGIPLIQSDKMVQAGSGSSMGAVTANGTTPPTLTLPGSEPLGAYNLRIEIVVGGALGVATFKFSVDGGNTFSANLITGASVPLIDTAPDSLVGVNGKTGIIAAFAAGTANADNFYTAGSNLAVDTLLIKRRALAFWFNSQALRLLTDKDILKDNDVAAMHLYRVAHLYRRVAGGTRPGVVKLRTNVNGHVAT